MTKKKILKNKKTPYLNPLANLECKNHWDFRDAVGLICQCLSPMDYAFVSGENDFSKTIIIEFNSFIGYYFIFHKLIF